MRRYDYSSNYECREYNSWSNMMARCYNKKNHRYKLYGGRGIKVCIRWHSFKNFLEDMGRRPTTRHTLERINNDRGYSKANCRWATPEEQAKNKRRNHMLTFKGKTQCLADWSKELNFSYAAMLFRLKTGWPVKDILTINVKLGNNKMCRIKP